MLFTAEDRIAKGTAAPEGTGQPDDTMVRQITRSQTAQYPVSLTVCLSSKDDHDDQDKEAKEGAAVSSSTTTKEKEPPKKYRLTEKMKPIFWQLYCLSNECSRLTNEKKLVFLSCVFFYCH